MTIYQMWDSIESVSDSTLDDAVAVMPIVPRVGVSVPDSIADYVCEWDSIEVNETRLGHLLNAISFVSGTPIA